LCCRRIQDTEQLRENDFARGQLRERLYLFDCERLAVENRGAELQLVASGPNDVNVFASATGSS